MGVRQTSGPSACGRGRAHFKQTLNVDLKSSDALTVLKMLHRAFMSTIMSCRISFVLILVHCQEPQC